MIFTETVRLASRFHFAKKISLKILIRQGYFLSCATRVTSYQHVNDHTHVNDPRNFNLFLL